MNKIQVKIDGIIPNSSVGGANTIVLKELDGVRVLPIIIGYSEALAIASELDGNKPPRPMTSDLMKTIIDYLSATISEIIINELRENTFYAKIILEVASFEHVIDSRPSDAIALALRFNAPIFVTEDVINRAGFEPSSQTTPNQNPLDFGYKKERSPKSKPSQTKLALLQEQLREALEREDYERAAKLRDEIKKLKS